MGNMKFLERGVYKIFAGLVLVSMIGALVAEPVVVGDLGLTLAQATKMVTGKSPDSTVVYKNSVSLGKVGAGIGATYGFRYGIRFAIRGAVIGVSAGPEGAIAGAIIGFAVGAA
ncbi:MAG: hypothetical protein GXN95_02120 [Methanococci archaeon]|nr:hypothetical protein [Methanococci archaeon]